MKKTLSYRLFGMGSIPGKIRPVIEAEQIIVADEGIGGWFITKRVKGPGKKYRNRAEGFSGCLVITKKRILCYTYWIRQINISVDDPRISEFSAWLPKAETLSIAFESSGVKKQWTGVVEFRFNTDAENMNPDGAAQMVPVFLSRSECAPAVLIQGITQFKDLMDKKCQQNKQEKIERRILSSMAVIVLCVVSLVFEGIEIFVFNFPPGATSNNEDFNIVLIDRDIGDPTGMKVCFAGSLDDQKKPPNARCHRHGSPHLAPLCTVTAGDAAAPLLQAGQSFH